MATYIITDRSGALTLRVAKRVKSTAVFFDLEPALKRAKQVKGLVWLRISGDFIQVLE